MKGSTGVFTPGERYYAKVMKTEILHEDCVFRRKLTAGATHRTRFCKQSCSQDIRGPTLKDNHLLGGNHSSLDLEKKVDQEGCQQCFWKGAKHRDCLPKRVKKVTFAERRTGNVLASVKTDWGDVLVFLEQIDLYLVY